MHEPAAFDLGLLDSPGIEIGKLPTVVRQAVAHAFEQPRQLLRLGRASGNVVPAQQSGRKRAELRPQRLDRIIHRDTRSANAARQHPDDPGHILVDSRAPGGILVLKLQIVVEIGRAAENHPIQRTFDLLRGSLLAAVERIIGDRARLDHHARAALQLGRRRSQPRRVQVTARQGGHSGQVVDSRNIHSPVACHDVAVERHVGHHALLEQQMSAREELLRTAVVAYLSEIVAGQQIGNDPEIAIAELLSFRSFVQHQPQQSVLQ